ncbi:NAD-dependent epimerase/dehydratase family protein [Streptomyces sp. SB3404]|uniref:NAD-dependent epimerase/dehydratase family protein n=1 Tax=Streptomyces boncukensis TaxID=2711219 RepID=A0A6G4WR76_9ACTN|nr:NAD-dependent epimerase/dehydratase family protein [Streptomyces boncukensis]NGO67523.1 NAD-dependent epimerase/dehydratase family protein [Streptomyces boncukensis]
MRIVVVGATGNVGTSLVRALAEDGRVASVLGLARRIPEWRPPKATWESVDVGQKPDLVRLFHGADAVVHLAWLFQPTHDPEVTWNTNALGSGRVFEAVAEANVPVLVYASSVGAYSPGSKHCPVDESWPTRGWPGAAYSREKAHVERMLDSFEREHTEVRVVRMRPGFIFKRESATEQRRLFAGPLLPARLVRPSLIPLVPRLRGLRFQVLHSDDAAEAYRLAIHEPVNGAFNLASEPEVDAEFLGALLNARISDLSVRPVRAALAAAWRLHLVPASPHLFDAVLRLPVMDTTRAEVVLGWRPRHTADDVLAEFLAGLRERAGMPTGPLQPRIPGGRWGEVSTGVGQKP